MMTETSRPRFGRPFAGLSDFGLFRRGLLTDMRDPYTVLGVAKGAAQDDIKKAYRRLAKKYHPDQSKEPKAKDRFAEVGSAYEILGDDKKRGQFDRGEIDADGKPRFTGGFEGFPGGRAGGPGRGGGFENFEFGGRGGRPGAGAGGFDAADIFADLFGGAAGARGGRSGGFGQQPRTPIRGEDVQAAVTISLAESVHGATTRVSLPTGRTLEVSVPAGIEDGKSIRLKAQGQQGVNGGSTGDATVTVTIAKHPYFRADGSDLKLDLPITLYEAVLGAKVAVPTLEGQVEMSIPAGTNGGRTLRLRGKGLLTPAKTRGDLLVALRIVLPDDAATSLQEVARDLAETRPYDPRKSMG